MFLPISLWPVLFCSPSSSLPHAHGFYSAVYHIPNFITCHSLTLSHSCSWIRDKKDLPLHWSMESWSHSLWRSPQPSRMLRILSSFDSGREEIPQRGEQIKPFSAVPQHDLGKLPLFIKYLILSKKQSFSSSGALDSSLGSKWSLWLFVIPGVSFSIQIKCIFSIETTYLLYHGKNSEEDMVHFWKKEKKLQDEQRVKFENC